MKKCIAIWLHGGIGTGIFSQGVPMLEKVIQSLASSYDIIVYSQAKPNDDYHPRGFEIRFPGKKAGPGWLRWLYLCLVFSRDHRARKFSLVLSFWGYPAGTIAVALGKVFNLPSVIYLQGGDAAGIREIDYGVFHRFWPAKIARWSYEHTSILVAMTAYQRDQLQRFGIRRNALIVPWGVDISQFGFKPRKRSGELRIVHVGHMSPVKDQSMLLRSFAAIHDKHPAYLEIYGGDGGSKHVLMALCHELGISGRVEFKGVVPYDQMPDRYWKSDLMLHTSLSEGQGMVLAEAAACGVLMAGTNVGLLYDLGEEYCIVVAPGDHKGLCQQVLSIVDDTKQWNEKIQRARDWTEAHTLQDTIRELEKLLDATLSSRDHNPRER